MKKSMLKRLCYALLFALAISGLYGCNGIGDSADSKKGNSGKMNLTYWAAMPEALASRYSSMAEITMYKELEKKTNVTIQFKHPPAGQQDEQFNLMIASRDLPDIIEYNWNSYPGGANKAIEDSVIIKLNDIFEKDCPNIKSAFDSNKAYDKLSKTDDGTYFGFPTLNTGKYRTFGGLILRKDWLDELGLKVPETISEWENVLTQFKDKKGAKSPFTGTLGSLTDLQVFNGAFATSSSFYLENGRVVYGPIQQNYKEYLRLMSDWYKKGLIDSEVTTNNSKAVDAKMTNGEAGVCYGYIGGTIGKYLTAMKSRDSKYDLIAAQHPKLKGDDIPRFMDCQQEAQSPFIAITTACKKPEAAAKWADYLYSDEGTMIKNFGVEGVTYTMENGVPKYTDLILKNPDGLSISEAMTLNLRVNSPSPGYNQHPSYLKQYYPLKQQQDALEIWTKYSKNASESLLPPLTPSSSEGDEFRNITAEIKTYVSEMSIKFIHGIEPIDKYDEFINKLKDMKIDRAIEIYQNAYNRFNDR